MSGLKRVMLVVLLAGVLSITQAQNTLSLVVFAAASLTDAFTEIGDAYMEHHKGIDVVLNFAGTSTLAAQIKEGALVDVFASANQHQMDEVIDDGRIDEAASKLFTFNDLVIAVPLDNPAGIESLLDLGRPGILLVLAAPDVPVRDYTDEVFARYDEAVDAGGDYLEAVQRNIVSEEANVRQVTAKIALGEADAGIVYRSDITPDISDRVLAIAIPDSLNVVAMYPIAALNDSPNPDLATDFIDFVMSKEGQAILESWGFQSPMADDEKLEPESTLEPDSDTTTNTDSNND